MKEKNYYSKRSDIIIKKIIILLVCLVIILVPCVSAYAAYTDSEISHYNVRYNGDKVTIVADLNNAYSYTKVYYQTGQQLKSFNGNKFDENITGQYTKANISFFPFGGNNYKCDYLNIGNYNRQIDVEFQHSCQLDVKNATVQRFIIGFMYELEDGSIERYEENLTYNNGVYSSSLALNVPKDCQRIYPYYAVTILGGSKPNINQNASVNLAVSNFRITFTKSDDYGVASKIVIVPIIEGVSGIFSGIGSGVVDLFETLFLTSSGQMSMLGMFLLTFVGVGLTAVIVCWIVKIRK